MDQPQGADNQATIETTIESAVGAEAPKAIESSQGEPTGLEALKQKATKLSPTTPQPDPVAPAYSPNFKFRFADPKGAGGRENQIEQEFDEWVRPLIKDAEMEKKVRDLYERAHGIDFLKADRQKARDEGANHQAQYDALSRGVDYLSTLIDKGDLNSFFKELKISEEKVLQYALSRVKYKELPPEERARIDAQDQTSQRLEYFERANQELLQAFQTTQVQQRTNELEGFLGRPEVSQTAQSFDQRMGRAGAFRDEVIRRGQYYASLPQPQDITVAQAVQEIMMLVGQLPQEASAPAQAAATPAAPEQKPIIPNIKGRGTSPVKKTPMSIDDLRAKARELGD